MAKEKAEQIDICVFTQTSKTRVFVYNTDGSLSGINETELTDTERMAWYAVTGAAVALGGDVKINTWICPYDYENNIQIINQQGFNALPARLPGVLMTAYYPSGTQRQYAIKNNPITSWTQDEVYRYLKALYLQEFGTGQSIVCKMLPVLCDVGAYAWLAAAAVCTYKTLEQKNNPNLQIAWGAGALLSVDAFVKGGGLKKVFGIGRIIRQHESRTQIKRDCKNGNGTTIPAGRGGCSWHGGYYTNTNNAQRANWRVEMRRALRKKGLFVPKTDVALHKKYVRFLGPYPGLPQTWL